MAILACFLLALLGGSAHAGVQGKSAPSSAVPFVPRYLGSLSMSLERKPLFAGLLLGSFEKHLTAVAPMRDPRQVEGYLRAEIEREGARTVPAARVAEQLGQEPLEPERAAAILLANGLSRPDQFPEVLEGMESMREAWGQRVAHRLKTAGELGVRSRRFERLLEEIGRRFMPLPQPSVYDSKGRLSGVYDPTP